jgi:hypothetical protein
VRFLIDEMFPPATCRHLLERGHDAVPVRDAGVDARPDAEVAALAAREQRALVTENVKDFARAEGIAIVCVIKSRLRAQGMDRHLAAVLADWAAAHADPYLGLHWPDIPSRRRR